MTTGAATLGANHREFQETRARLALLLRQAEQFATEELERERLAAVERRASLLRELDHPATSPARRRSLAAELPAFDRAVASLDARIRRQGALQREHRDSINHAREEARTAATRMYRGRARDHFGRIALLVEELRAELAAIDAIRAEVTDAAIGPIPDEQLSRSAIGLSIIGAAIQTSMYPRQTAADWLKANPIGPSGDSVGSPASATEQHQPVRTVRR